MLGVSSIVDCRRIVPPTELPTFADVGMDAVKQELEQSLAPARLPGQSSGVQDRLERRSPLRPSGHRQDVSRTCDGTNGTRT
jgi:hypothetical protein